MIGKPGSSVLVTLAEPKTRYSVIAKAPDKSAQAVTDALLTALQPHADLLVHTLTYDNGKEFAYHQTVRDSTPKATSPTPTILGARTQREHQRAHPAVPAQGHRFPLPHTRAGPQHQWTGSTTGHGNVWASRLQISYSQESTHLLHLRVESVPDS